MLGPELYPILSSFFACMATAATRMRQTFFWLLKLISTKRRKRNNSRCFNLRSLSNVN